MKLLRAALLVVSLAFAACGGPSQHATGQAIPPLAARAANAAQPRHLPLRRIPLAAHAQAAESLALGPRGGMWYFDANARGVGYVTPRGGNAYFATLGQRFGSVTSPCQFVADAQHVWFAGSAGDIVELSSKGRIVREIALHDGAGDAIVPNCLALGGDGTVWFTTFGTYVGYVSPNGKATLKIGIGRPSRIAVASNGDAYYSNADTNAHDVVVELGPKGLTKAQYPLPAVFDFCTYASFAPDGNLWLSDAFGSVLLKMTPQGAFTVYPLGAAFPRNSTISGLTAGVTGDLWEAATTPQGVVTLARIQPAGTVTGYAVGVIPATTSLATGSNGNLYLNALQYHSIYEIYPPR